MAEEAENQRMVTINDKQYAFDALSDVAKKQLVNIRVVEAKLEDLNNQLAILQAAKKYYVSVLEKELF